VILTDREIKIAIIAPASKLSDFLSGSAGQRDAKT
jgi:hypothetical protein